MTTKQVKPMEPKDGLTCGICGGRIYVAKGEPDYRMCNCSLKDVWNFIRGIRGGRK